jgi:hypothetical protein
VFLFVFFSIATVAAAGYYYVAFVGLCWLPWIVLAASRAECTALIGRSNQATNKITKYENCNVTFTLTSHVSHQRVAAWFLISAYGITPDSCSPNSVSFRGSIGVDTQGAVN